MFFFLEVVQFFDKILVDCSIFPQEAAVGLPFVSQKMHRPLQSPLPSLVLKTEKKEEVYSRWGVVVF